MKYQMLLCDCCVQAIKSHGEKVIILDVIQTEDLLESECQCNFCRERLVNDYIYRCIIK